jgi:RimJ/RimL family protein N-acetyltransferase
MSTERWIRPVTLEGTRVRLEPLAMHHLPDLAEVALDAAIWRWMPIRVASVADLRAWLEAALRNAEAGTEVPFATILRETGRAIGSTRYLSIVPEHRRLEIGYTWVAPAWQRSGANREAKLLQLTHAFEALEPRANRVEFKTDSRNEKSRAGILGIGATFEGVFRDHMIVPEPGLRSSAYYSITASEWPEVKTFIVAGLERLR